MIDQALSIIESYMNEHGLKDLSLFSYDREAADNLLCEYAAHQDYFFKVKGRSLIVGSRNYYPFTRDVVCNVVKLVGGDGNARKLLKEFQIWAIASNAKLIQFSNFYSQDSRLESYIERLGFRKIGSVFIQEFNL